MKENILASRSSSYWCSRSANPCEFVKLVNKRETGHCPERLFRSFSPLTRSPPQMTTRRGIFFSSKSRSVDTHVLVNSKTTSPPPVASSDLIPHEETSSGSSQSQTSPPKTTAIPAGIVKKKLILKGSKRTLAKTMYSGPRKIFSTSYKVRASSVCRSCSSTAQFSLGESSATEP